MFWIGFTFMANLSKANDQERAEESRQSNRDGYEPVLNNSHRLLLKLPENLTAKRGPRLAELLRYKRPVPQRDC